MEEVRFCEDCKWCDINYLPWYKRIGFGLDRKCFHPKVASCVGRSSRYYAMYCDLERYRSNDGACGKEGRLYEPKGVK